MAAEMATSQPCPACATSIDTTRAEPLTRIACPNCGEKVRIERAFNNFVLIETLGVGGMGAVYKAHDTVLDRLVALKLLRRDLGGGIDQTAHLRQEARIAASINHPNVIQVFSSGTDHGQFYVVMELVDHGSLDDLIEDGKTLSEEQALETGIQIAKGLQAAQRKSLIHRDVKPANILFADQYTAKISDFGLARVALEKAERHGEIWGTPYYVAPERLQNQPEDFRTDIYSLGATLFHAVAGKAPIDGETNSAVALRELKQKPLDLRRLAPELSPVTARILQRMIAFNPAERFSSYDEVVAELDRARRNLLGGRITDLGGRRQKRRAVFWIAAGALLAGIAIGISFLAGAFRPQPSAIPTGELERQFAEARRELVREHHNVARAAFARIAMEAKNRQPLYNWLRLNEGLAALVAREQSQAQQAFRDVAKSGQNGFGSDNRELANFFRATATTLSSGRVIPVSAAKIHDGFSGFALLLFALHDISYADPGDAERFLEQFVTWQPAGKFAWIAEYRVLAQKYLDDCRLYIAWKNQAPGNDLTATIEQVRATRKQLKTHSAISDAMNAEEKDLARRAAGKENAGIALQYHQQRKLTTNEKGQWLSSWKKRLIDDLNERHFSAPVADRRGVHYAGIDSATPERLTMKIAAGIVQVDWRKFSPKTLLSIARSFIQPNTPEAADRQWLCAVYAKETGQIDAARELAASAARLKPEYRDYIESLISSAPTR